jgi:acetolactate synthase-1/3 small subunit
MMEKFSVELLVSNHYGVLNRITGLYARRGYNIDSLYVNVTENPDISRMMIVSKGDEYIQTQMVRQLSKLYDVKEVTLLTQTKR